MAQEKAVKEEGTKKTAEEIKKGTTATEEVITEGKNKEGQKAMKTKTTPDEKAKDIKEEVNPEIIKSEEKVTKVTEEKTTETKEQGAKVEKSEEKKTLGKVYTIPLSDVYGQPWSKRARKATRMVREFLQKHTKKEVKIAGDVNEAIWSRGMKHPPRKIRVNVETEDNIATARLLK